VKLGRHSRKSGNPGYSQNPWMPDRVRHDENNQAWGLIQGYFRVKKLFVNAIQFVFFLDLDSRLCFNDLQELEMVEKKTTSPIAHSSE
jgi:hypothetical protein